MTPKSSNENDIYVGSRVRIARQLSNISQEKLGDQLGISFQQIQKYEKGSNRISASKLIDISRTLNVPVAWFFKGIEQGERVDIEPEQFFQSKDGLRLLRIFTRATSSQQKLIIELADTVIKSTSAAAD
ncbi:helix-turn-helix domain-containing protein [Cohaesibacter celericrescens]|uniref:Transcriptional regulator n=1 Tax=Cohaesibacter celericrescens TaxID=2067669 RepID=A0A2N5XTV4_9HYPH|nr:helix-turn-helix transcriptional regulator [Cohaesibacter celericrescens]PLW77933.1 transcriptional regulator [Cohaesibacter celericrescens]